MGKTMNHMQWGICSQSLMILPDEKEVPREGQTLFWKSFDFPKSSQLRTVSGVHPSLAWIRQCSSHSDALFSFQDHSLRKPETFLHSHLVSMVGSLSGKETNIAHMLWHRHTVRWGFSQPPYLRLRIWPKKALSLILDTSVSLTSHQLILL